VVNSGNKTACETNKANENSVAAPLSDGMLKVREQGKLRRSVQLVQVFDPSTTPLTKMIGDGRLS
jgi:hypothetical protein